MLSKELITRIHAGSSGDKMIAGGAAVSCFIPGFQYKDVDIFFPGIYPNVKRLEKVGAVEIEAECAQGEESSGPHSSRRFVLESDPKLDFVFQPDLYDFQEILENFDLGLSMCGYVINEDYFLMLPPCVNDLMNHTITITKHRGKTQERAEKYLSRLPGWKIVDLTHTHSSYSELA